MSEKSNGSREELGIYISIGNLFLNEWKGQTFVVETFEAPSYGDLYKIELH